MTDDNADYREIFGRDPEPWRAPLGALRITLMGDPEAVDVRRAQHEVEELVRVLNEGAAAPLPTNNIETCWERP